MSDAKFHLVPRASIIASGATDDFGYVAPDEVVLVSVEALERAERERDEQLEDSERIIAALVRERDALKSALKTVAVRQREACAQHTFSDAVEEVEAVRATPLVTEGGE